MTLDDKKEILKAKFYDFSEDFILETYEITKEEFDKIVAENQDYLNDLGERSYA